MHSLIAELQRLFGRPGQDLPDPLPADGVDLDLVSPDGRVWAMAVGVAPAAGWAPVAALCEGAVNGLALPPPAVSLAAGAGFRVWFSLADPVPLARAASRDWVVGTGVVTCSPSALTGWPACASPGATMALALIASSVYRALPVTRDWATCCPTSSWVRPAPRKPPSFERYGRIGYGASWSTTATTRNWSITSPARSCPGAASAPAPTKSC